MQNTGYRSDVICICKIFLQAMRNGASRMPFIIKRRFSCSFRFIKKNTSLCRRKKFMLALPVIIFLC